MARQRRVVGRTAEMAALVAAVDGIAAAAETTADTPPARHRLVQLSGEPGIGKTRMLAWLADRAAATGLPVLKGSATEFETDVPFGLLTDALADRLRELGDVLSDRMSEERLRLVGTVFPALLPTGGPAQPSDGERYRLHRALRSLLEAITPADGMVLCLDDLHWADDATCEFLAHLAHRPLRAPLLLALSYRPRQLPARLAEALRVAPSARLALGPLSRGETEELAGVDAGSRRGAELFRASGGNPLYVELLARAAGPGALIDSPAGRISGDAGAQTLTDAFTRELRGLSEEDRTVLWAAAVVGDDFDPNLVAAITRRPVAAALAALDRLSARDLVRADTTDPRLRHRHPLLRRAAYRDASAQWRLAAHRRAWQVLAGQGAPAATIARHVAESAQPGDEAAIAVLLAAADATEVTAPSSAAHWLAVALDLIPDGQSEVRRRLSLLAKRARALGMAGHFGDASDVLAQVLALLPATEAEQRASATAMLAMIERLLGRFDRARTMLLAELAAHPDRRGQAAAVLLFELALGGLLGAGPDEGAPWATQALSAARELGDPAQIAAALAVCGLHDLIGGRWTATARDRIADAVALTDALTDGQLAGRLDATVWVGWCELLVDRFVDAARHLERGLAVARSTGQHHLVGYLRVGLGIAYAALGRLSVAAERVTDAVDGRVDGALATGGDELADLASAQHAWIEAWRGNLTEAADIVGGMGQTGAVGGSGPLDSTGGTPGADATAGGGDDVTDPVVPGSGGDVLETGAIVPGADHDQPGVGDGVGVRGAGGPGASVGLFAATAGALRALVAHVSGNPVDCVSGLVRSAGGPDLPFLDATSRACWFQLLTEAEVVAGRPERAHDWAVRAARAADVMPLPRKQAFADLARAWALSAAEPSVAAGVAELAARSFGELTDRVSQGRALLLAGQCRASAGDAEVAKRLLADAERVFTGCGAQGFADQAARARRRPGRRGAPEDGGTRLSVLTERERAVAALVAEGHTNREVATALYLSARTVEAHLTRVYAKLGLSSRSALASQVSRD
jgi:DNA-binding CsgD family transcriptional regulator